jgi:transcriptional regulator with PAS, ATPase and Fis domain
MSLTLQVKLLRVLQERQVMRIGSQGVTNINIRVVAATNCDLREKIRLGQFREDLFYRLNVLPLKIPPLRERTGDVLFLLQRFIDEDDKEPLILSSEVKDILTRYSWPGNIRELANVASYISFMAKKTVEVEHLPYYLIEGQDDFDAEYKGLRNRCECGDALLVLESLSEFALCNRSVGRNSLKDALKLRDAALPEGEIRRLLVVLGDYGLVNSSRGRRGSEITAKGKAFLRWSRSGAT